MSANFMKSQTVSILGLVGYIASVATTQLCCCREKVVTDNLQTNGCGLCSNTTLPNRAGSGLSGTVIDPCFTSGVGTLGTQVEFFSRPQGNISKGEHAPVGTLLQKPVLWLKKPSFKQLYPKRARDIIAKYFESLPIYPKSDIVHVF